MKPLVGIYYEEYFKALRISVILRFLILIVVAVGIFKNTSLTISIIYIGGLIMYGFFEMSSLRQQQKTALQLLVSDTVKRHELNRAHSRRIAFEDDDQAIERRE